MQGFHQRYAELKALGARVAGVSADSWASQGAFQEKYGFEFPLLSDWPENKTIAAFGVAREQGPTARRATFIFDAEGILRDTVTDERDMDAHPAGALEAVKQLAAEAGG